VSSVLHLADGLRFSAGPLQWQLQPLSVTAGDWVALVPAGPEPALDPSPVLARILGTLEEPDSGVVELLGEQVSRIEYRTLQRLRARVGFVHRSGGLLSNRTVRENLALPLSVHSGLGPGQLSSRVEAALGAHALDGVSELRPHRIDAVTAWRVRVARALMLDPEWIVFEGRGLWRPSADDSTAWARLADASPRRRPAAAVCLRHTHAEFEAWFSGRGGTVIRYTPVGGKG